MQLNGFGFLRQNASNSGFQTRVQTGEPLLGPNCADSSQAECSSDLNVPQATIAKNVRVIVFGQSTKASDTIPQHWNGV